MPFDFDLHIFTQFFLNHEVILSSHTMLINAFTKDFTLKFI